MTSKKTVAAMLILMLVVVPAFLYWLNASYWFGVAGTMMVFAILAVSANLITGTTGLLSLGHAGFYGIGAYTAAMTATAWHWPFYLTIPEIGRASCRERVS